MRILARLLLAACALGVAVTVAEAQGLPRRTSNEPQLVKEVAAEYTPDGRTAGIEGCVLLSAEVLTDGTVGEVKIVGSLDANQYGLDDEAVKAMKQWLFKPATQDGAPVTMGIHVGLCFSLKKLHER